MGGSGRSASCGRARRASLDELTAELFVLLSRYGWSPCTALAVAIVELLTALCEHDEIALLPDQQAAYARLLNGWRARVCVHAGSGAFRVH